MKSVHRLFNAAVHWIRQCLLILIVCVAAVTGFSVLHAQVPPSGSEAGAVQALSSNSVSSPLLQLWQFVDADSSWPDPPGRTVSSAAVELDTEQFDDLRLRGQFLIATGDSNELRLLPVRIRKVKTYVNGDEFYNAEVMDGGKLFPAVFTVGRDSIFGHLETADKVWQLQAVRAAGAAVFKGWLYESQALLQTDLINDYVIPQRADLHQHRQPLILTGEQQIVDLLAPARSSGINNGNLQINQQFSRSSAFIGDPVDVTINFSNISSERHQSLTADIYFVLENSSLESAPANCGQIVLTGQRVLRCQLGDFSAGQMRSITYTVRTSEQSKPWLMSTVIIGSLRNDAFINVADDIAADADGDGLSDFNERLLGTDPFDALSTDRGPTIIDVMALYTDDALSLYQGYAETRINQLIGVANQVYADSGVSIILRPVYHRQIMYPEQHDMDTMLENLTAGTHSAFTDIPALRETYGADLVMLFRPHRNENDRCGLANLGGYNSQGDFSAADEKDFAFSVIAIDCPVSSVVAHELGHNMGLSHSRREDGAGGTLPYATGYGVDSSFVTVMAYPGAFNTDLRIGRFSDPNVFCQGEPCGVDHRDVHHGADAVRVLNLVRHQIARFYPSKVAMFPMRKVASYSGIASNAIITSAVTVDGLNSVSGVTPGQAFDIRAEFQIDSNHRGLNGNFHVLVGLGNSDFISVTADGRAELWDGVTENILAFNPQPVPLNAVEFLQILRNGSLDASYVGRQLEIYIGYSVPSLYELIYTLEPLLIGITP